MYIHKIQYEHQVIQFCSMLKIMQYFHIHFLQVDRTEHQE